MGDSWRNKREIHETVSTQIGLMRFMTRASPPGHMAASCWGPAAVVSCSSSFRRSKKPVLLDALSDLVPVDFTIGAPGSTIVLYEPNGWDAAGNDPSSSNTFI